MPTNGDPLVLSAQQWLNATYGNDSRYEIIPENGKTGWTTIYALTRALQIELGITNTADSFGPTTVAMFNSYYPTGIHQQAPDDNSEHNIYAIIQGALFCKGYATGVGTVTRHFYNGTGNAIKSLKQDAGVDATSSTVTLNIMRALLSMDYFYSYDTSLRTQNIQTIQRYLNANYESYIGGLIPCDGLYGRKTNKALIFAIQAEEGMPASVANGNFGPTTRNCCPTLPYNNVETNYYGNIYTSAKIEKFTKILNMGLYINEVGDSSFSTTLDSNSVRQFQNKYALPITGIANLTTWLSVFISSGDTSRSALACDCATILTTDKAQTLYNNGYRYVGRYLSGTAGGISKALTVNEIQIAFNAGLRIFPIQQSSANTVSYFTEQQGIADATSAYTYATNLGIPSGTIIYFAVDCDPQDTDITSNILPYFAKVNQTMINSCNSRYRIGIYGTRNACTRVSNQGYAVSSFVSDMSTGYSGNLGFTIPNNWAFDQFTTVTVGSGNGQIEIDKDGFSGRDTGFGTISLSDIEIVYNNLKDLYGYVLPFADYDVSTANLMFLQYLRYLHPNQEYGSPYSSLDKWAIVAGEIDQNMCIFLDAILPYTASSFEFEDPINNNVTYDFIHFAATLNALLFDVINPDFLPFDSLIDHYVGWAGDAITFAENIKQQSLTQSQANTLICSLAASNFTLADYFADVDAVVFANMLNNELMPIPEMFFKYFISNNYITGQSYLAKRTTNFVSIMGVYNIFMQTVNDIMNSSSFPYPFLRNMIVSPESDYTTEFSMSSIAFLLFVASELTNEAD